ncbi:elongator complex protein 3 [Patescibacteria group bacterium]
MSKFDFNPTKYKKKLIPLLKDLLSITKLDAKKYHQVLRKYPKSKSNLFSKSEIIAGLRQFHPQKAPQLVKKIIMKPVRTMSGVVPITLLTKPYPCPGQCIFCPNDPQMPKSYLSAEPGAQRAAKNQFNPYNQVYSRLQTYYANGHSTDKAELIVLGGTWSVYPTAYKIWFIKRCFDALNDFQPTKQIKLKKSQVTGTSTWSALKKSQLKNETAVTRCIGLSLETRPDFITKSELINFRKLGCTKVQIGIQSLDNQVLKFNQRGHSIKETKQAIQLLRLFGFKIQAHWMANLYGSSVAKDIADFKKLFSDKHYRPDELKIYPTSLLATAKLMDYFNQKLWQPYTQAQLLKVLVNILPIVPAYCRVTRMIRDFSSDDIMAGNKATNFRQIVEAKLKKPIQEIRSREIKQKSVNLQGLSLKAMSYQTSTGAEKFLQFITPANQIAAFLRLSLPKSPAVIKQLENSSIIREIHVYGQALEIGDQHTKAAQHLGLGTKLIQKAKTISKKQGFKKISVISAIGTKQYYKNKGFKSGNLYQYSRVD